MRRTNLGDLVVPFLVIGLTAYVLLRISYQDLPPLRYFTAVPVFVLGVAEFIAARRVRAAVRHDPNAKPMAAIVIARCVALGKASSLVGAGLAGATVALLLRVLPDAGRVTAAASDARVGGTVLVGATLLLVGGLVLERAGIDPNSDNRGP